MKQNHGAANPILQPCGLPMYAYQMDPYKGCKHGCSYCYALNKSENEDNGALMLHQDLVSRLETDLAILEPQVIYIGMNTDPYQPEEETHQQTRQTLELLSRRGFSVSLLTKSNLVIRDIDLLAGMKGSTVGFSLAFHEEKIRQLFEQNPPSNSRRIEALEHLNSAGIETYVLICPVMPYLSEVDMLIDLVAPFADTIWVYPIRMKQQTDRNWRKLHRILDKHYPELVDEYRQIAFEKQHSYWGDLRSKLEMIKTSRRLNINIEL
jgi:DNA repair photolyase